MLSQLLIKESLTTICVTETPSFVHFGLTEPSGAKFTRFLPPCLRFSAPVCSHVELPFYSVTDSYATILEAFSVDKSFITHSESRAGGRVRRSHRRHVPFATLALIFHLLEALAADDLYALLSRRLPSVQYHKALP